ncbi:hypothetical protein [Pendulispora albinea]|uniref:Uncharacterized protein n=1 Tax=Pendulispora albinea TaxID=2741071 RepID=A0ABZ2LXA0_9BACT
MSVGLGFAFAITSMAACNAVPDLFFVDGKDAGSDPGPVDGGGSSDADYPDTDDVDPGEAGAGPSTCPGKLPANATTCCAGGPCHGFDGVACGYSACSQCEERCAPNTLCCVKKNGTPGKCIGLDQTCPR